MTKPTINMDLFNKLTQRYSSQNGRSGNSKSNNFPDQGFDFDTLRGVGKYILRLMPYDKESVAQNGSIMPFHIQNKHYNLGKDRKEQAVCTGNLAEGAVCPICNALEELRELEFPQEQLRPYDISTKVVLKCLLIKTPEKDRSELPMDRMTLFYVSLSVANQLLKKYSDASTYDLFNPDKACAIALEREKPRDKWTLTVLDSSCEESGILGFTPENKAKLVEISNNVKFEKIYKIPSDDKITHYKELARELKKQVISAKKVVETATSEFQSEIDAASAEVNMPNKIEVNIPKPVASEPPVAQVPTPKVEVSTPTVEIPTPQTVVAQAEGEFGPDPDWTEEQKQIINSYRGVCDKPCFGNLKAYDPKCMRCMSDNYSAQCSAAIKLAYGVDVPLF